MKSFTKPLGTFAVFAMFASFLFAAAANAQSQSDNRKNKEMSGGEKIVMGQVVDTINVNLAGVAGNGHRLVKIQNRDGKRMVVDLGVEGGLEGLELSPGDRIVATGKSARIDGQPVLYAKVVGKLYATGQSGVLEKMRQDENERIAQNRDRAQTQSRANRDNDNDDDNQDNNDN